MELTASNIAFLLLCSIYVSTTVTLTVETKSKTFPEELKCRIQHKDGVLTSFCNKRNLKEVPTNLNPDIEVLNLVDNRITSIKKSDFQSYPKLTEIHLAVNQISQIENDAFEDLPNLHTLNLGQNNIKSFTARLPKSLHTLDVAYNPIQTFDPESSDSYRVNSTYIVGAKLTKFPKLKPSNDVFYINLWNNHISKISINEIAPFCNLTTLDLRKNPIKFNKAEECECQHFTKWLFKFVSDWRIDFFCPENPVCENVIVEERGYSC